MILSCFLTDSLQRAVDYAYPIFKKSLFEFPRAYMIRRSTGQLSIDLSPTNFGEVEYFPPCRLPTFTMAELGPNPESKIISSLTIDNFHYSTAMNPSRFYLIPLPVYMSVQLSSIISMPENPQEGDPKEIAYSPGYSWYDFGWYTSPSVHPVIMATGWSRFDSSCIPDESIFCRIIDQGEDWQDARHIWIAQANHIFSRLHITSNYENYVLIDHVQCTVALSETLGDIPNGYLFLCPFDDLQTSDRTRFRCPDLPAYWSLDPSGLEILNAEEAENLGFPSLELIMEVWAPTWDGTIHEALRRFHRAKGFDPESQDVARSLGYPLYKLSSEQETEFAFFEDDSDTDAGYHTSGSGYDDIVEANEGEVNEKVDKHLRDVDDIFQASDGAEFTAPYSP
ncbi:hypothetical protein B0H10DRAFT_2023335 [Mycena sp. CBHHK59/15]|nr:hypothetical protein B0H10DRAFT_2023335 [Mycena sp. CBHHK59/15]